MRIITKYRSRAGSVFWRRNGERHRGPDLNGKDLPATLWHNGDRDYWFDGQPHRLDGPAIDNKGIFDEYYLAGERLNPEEWIRRVTQLRERSIR